jgi:hypothetical protein
VRRRRSVRACCKCMSYTVLRSDSATILGLQPASAVQRRGALVASGASLEPVLLHRSVGPDQEAAARAPTLLLLLTARHRHASGNLRSRRAASRRRQQILAGTVSELPQLVPRLGKEVVVYRPDIGLDGCVARSSCRPSLDRVAWGQVRRGSKWPFSPGSRSIGPRALSDPG